MTSLCGIHVPGPDGIGGASCPACALMVRLAHELASKSDTRGKAAARAKAAKYGTTAPTRLGRLTGKTSVAMRRER